ncbi:MAG: S8 family peptidase [Marinilabiliaceae bacterium]|nr:S8 family peptidase [Marinilabiliaceae bacterium]
MRKFFLIILLTCLTTLLFAQNRKGNFQILEGCDNHELYVSFYSDDFFYLDDSETKEQIDRLIYSYSIKLERCALLPEKKIDQLTQNNRKGANPAIEKLKRIYKVHIPDADNALLYQLAAQFEELDEVEYASLVPIYPIQPPISDTPDFEYLQTYLNTDPGVDIYYAWSLGLYGENIRIRDIEYGFNGNHEVLVGRNLFIAPGMDIHPETDPDWCEHGTAVFGMVYAHNENFGNKGMAHGAQEMVLFPEYQSSGYNRINAIAQAIENSTEGDVIIYEMQYPAYSDYPDSYVPAEFHPIVWDLTKAATEAGIIVVAAAGNGAQNLDIPYFDEYNNRGNSGAIIVGAGNTTIYHAPMYFTTYGSRIDVQAWGQNVFTSGYGSYIQINNDFNRGYTMFSGTSSATPIVASCVIILQSYWHSLTGEYLSSRDMRDLLVETGNPQLSQLTKPIGPIPNMKNAIEMINGMIECEMPVNVQIVTDEDCIVHIFWEKPQDMINPTYNIYRNNELVAENIEDTFYSEYIDPEVIFEWSVRTVCQNGMSKKVRIFNEICECDCLPAFDLKIEIDALCNLQLSWNSPYDDPTILYNVYKDNVLVAENLTSQQYSEIIESDIHYEWCVQILCDDHSPKRCIKNELCHGGDISEVVLKKTYRFYPNPVKNELTIERTDFLYETIKIEVSNIQGNNVYTTDLETNQVIINFDNFKSGVYLLKIYDSDNIFVKKIVKK